MARSLKEYLETTSDRTPDCKVCKLGQVSEINEALRLGIRPHTIANWLRDEHGVEGVMNSNISYHKGRGHHRA